MLKLFKLSLVVSLISVKFCMANAPVIRGQSSISILFSHPESFEMKQFDRVLYARMNNKLPFRPEDYRPAPKKIESFETRQLNKIRNSAEFAFKR